MKYPTIIQSLLIVLAVFTLAGAASAQVDLRFEPTDPSVDMGDSMRLGIYLDEAIDVRTFEITLSYDDTYLSSLGGDTGSLFDGSSTGFEEFDDSTPGQWYGRVVVLGDPVPVGPGELYYWDVQGDQAGLAALSSVSIRMADGDAVEYTVNPLTGTLEVIPPFETPVLDPEPSFTPGTSNTLIWVDTGAAEYQVQVSTDSAFSTILQDSGWITDTSHPFTGLTSGETYYYRLRGRTPAPDYTSPWSASESSTQDDESPTSSAQPPGTYQTGQTFEIPWTASDGLSGLDRIELWFDDDDDGSYDLYVTDENPSANTPFTFTAETEGPHAFYTVAIDLVGNEEAAPGTPDVTTLVDTVDPTTSAGPLDPSQT
ncbi:hypothetical protein GF314_04045, partial [bacterium]|nr:hypothetical protein [bacterium]